MVELRNLLQQGAERVYAGFENLAGTATSYVQGAAASIPSAQKAKEATTSFFKEILSVSSQKVRGTGGQAQAWLSAFVDYLQASGQGALVKSASFKNLLQEKGTDLFSNALQIADGALSSLEKIIQATITLEPSVSAIKAKEQAIAPLKRLGSQLSALADPAVSWARASAQATKEVLGAQKDKALSAMIATQDGIKSTFGSLKNKVSSLAQQGMLKAQEINAKQALIGFIIGSLATLTYFGNIGSAPSQEKPVQKSDSPLSENPSTLLGKSFSTNASLPTDKQILEQEKLSLPDTPSSTKTTVLRQDLPSEEIQQAWKEWATSFFTNNQFVLTGLVITIANYIIYRQIWKMSAHIAAGSETVLSSKMDLLNKQLQALKNQQLGALATKGHVTALQSEVTGLKKMFGKSTRQTNLHFNALSRQVTDLSGEFADVQASIKQEVADNTNKLSAQLGSAQNALLGGITSVREQVAGNTNRLSAQLGSAQNTLLGGITSVREQVAGNTNRLSSQLGSAQNALSGGITSLEEQVTGSTNTLSSQLSSAQNTLSGQVASLGDQVTDLEKKLKFSILKLGNLSEHLGRQFGHLLKSLKESIETAIGEAYQEGSTQVLQTVTQRVHAATFPEPTSLSTLDQQYDFGSLDPDSFPAL